MSTQERSTTRAEGDHRLGIPRELKTPETKHFSKTSEFFIWALAVAAILVATLVTEGLGPDRAWTLVTVVTSAYILSRGIAKAGTSKGLR